MRASRVFVLAALILAALCPPTASGGEKKPKALKARPVKIVESWNGKLADGALRKAEPADGFILDQEAWDKLWKAWRGQEKVPAVDFHKQMVLVFTADGPNSVGCTPTLDGKGNVRADAMSTMIGGPGFGYLLLCIPREGVQTVNGKPLPGVKVLPSKPRPKYPRGQPGSSPGGEPGVVPGSPPLDSVSSSPPSGGEPGTAGEAQPGTTPLPPIQECEKVAPKPGVFQALGSRKPLVLHSEKEAAEHSGEQELAKLVKQVDFAQQFVLVFAWRGSGQDRLKHAVAESFPEQVFFRYKPGRTRDKRPHVHVYVLRLNVTWNVN